ncbi:MAG: RidA family protein [Defluviitaleaceae bacterium]|nr:RidA family protein [Defluviitaleaceae bacterium]
MNKKVISAKNAPEALGPYSQAVKCGNMLFLSGQTPIIPADGTLIKDDIKAATAQCFENIKSVLEAAGASLENVVKMTVFLKDFDDFAAMNEVYKSYFSGSFPARSCIQAAKLPLDCMVEIEAIAMVD